MKLRPPQEAAVNAVWDYYRSGKTGNVIIAAATGTGKSVICAKITMDIVSLPNRRVLQLSHVKEILTQNFSKLIAFCPSAPVGIYSASLGKKQLGHQIIIAGIQSVYRKGWELGFFHAVLIDECHLLADSEDGMYRTLIATLKQINPNVRIIGLSATPWRMKGGLLTEGKNAIFDEIIYEYTIRQAIIDGYLCPVIRKSSKVQADLSKVRTQGGEYALGDMQLAIDKEEITQAALNEIELYASDRKSWLIFCAGVEHARHVRDALIAREISSECVTGETPADERDRILSDFKNGKIRAITNNAVLTTGTDIPSIDLIVLLRGTKSPGLMLQLVGRGMRLHPEKDNCMILDFAGNLERFGPIDLIKAPKVYERDEKGEAPEKVCPECQTICPISTRNCPECDYEFPIDSGPKHARKASDAPAMSTEQEWIDIDSASYNRHTGKTELIDDGDEIITVKKPDTLRVTYLSGVMIYREWICLEHEGFPKARATRWVEERLIIKDGTPTEEFYKLAGKIRIDDVVMHQQYPILHVPKSIRVKKEGKYEIITEYKF